MTSSGPGLAQRHAEALRAARSAASEWSTWPCVSTTPPAPAALGARGDDRVQVLLEQRPRVDHPGRVAPEHPGVGPVQRQQARVVRADADDVERRSRALTSAASR